MWIAYFANHKSYLHFVLVRMAASTHSRDDNGRKECTVLL